MPKVMTLTCPKCKKRHKIRWMRRQRKRSNPNKNIRCLDCLWKETLNSLTKKG